MRDIDKASDELLKQQAIIKALIRGQRSLEDELDKVDDVYYEG